ncbi:MAG: hypothetical protein ABJL99_18855 [Aliishimia sp.]
MTSKDQIERKISQAALEIPDLQDGEKEKGIAELLTILDRRALPPSDVLKHGALNVVSKFGASHQDYGTASVKFSNYFISWRKILLAGGSIPASYLSSTLTAMTILGFLTKGAVHVFDKIDAKILAVIHKNWKALPMTTQGFYDAHAASFPPEINKDLFLERVVDLSGYGAISIDEDLLKITEVIYSFDR